MSTFDRATRAERGHGVIAELLALAAFFAVAFATAWVGYLLTAPSVGGWYAVLAKPAWNPPAWVFTPIWLTLFALMAVAGWLVWLRRERASVAGPLALFGVQLALNAAWSGLFFALRLPGAALAEVIVLWLAVLVTLLAFWRVRVLAGLLLVPYLLWVGFAAALNFTLWRLNG